MLIEALAAGAILVTSDIPEISESVHHGENGLLIKDYESAAAIAAMIRTACTDGHHAAHAEGECSSKCRAL